MIKIFIVDDHELVREGLKKIFREEDDFQVIDEASSGNEAVEKIKNFDCDVMLLDLSMPGKSGLELISELITIKPNLPILILSIHPEDQFAVRCLKAGASGFVSKDVAMEDLVLAIRKVHQKGRYISNRLAEHLAFNIKRDEETPPHEKLSNREHQIMCMLASGKKVKDIANELSLSISSIFTFRTRIFEKLDVKSNVDLTHYAINHKLID